MRTDLKIDNCEKLTEDRKKDLLIDSINYYEAKETNLIQILHMAQAIYGFISPETQNFIASQMKIPYSKITGVVTFYSFFNSKPKGKYEINICLGTACYVRGGKKILEELKEILGIEVGETTEDKLFSIEVMRCIGACGLAPAISINGKVYKQVTPNKIKKIINDIKKEESENENS